MATLPPQLRVARPVRDLAATRRMYSTGLDWQVLFEFRDHAGFDGVMLGPPGAAYHFEFTHCTTHPVEPRSTPEDLVVLYLPDAQEWRARCERMEAAGFRAVPSFNPYWDARGRTYEDADGYRVVIQNAAWAPG